ncbi:MAG: Sporulation initiation inhibitor protein Soj, partial [Bacteroidota bacterium]
MKIIAFFNNKGGVGKTTLVYHLAWMMSELGKMVVVADLDPQANLSAMFLSNDTLANRIEDKKSVIEALRPRMKGIGDINEAHLERIDNNLYLLIGDLALSTFEDKLSRSWNDCLNREEGAFLDVSAFYRICKNAAQQVEADIVLVDVGPNLGAINRTALIAADSIIVPVAADLFSIQGMSNLGKTLVNWRAEWQDRLSRNPTPDELVLPKGNAHSLGYILSQHGVRASRPV